MTDRVRKDEESPDSTEQRIRSSRAENAGKSCVMESATENRPPARARVKWRCKRPPVRLKQRTQGKPSSEQDQIGDRTGGSSGLASLRCRLSSGLIA